MRVRFWGTRRIPSCSAERRRDPAKNQAGPAPSQWRQFESEAAIERFIDGELDFPTRHGYGGNLPAWKSWVATNYTVCDMGSGLRCLGQQVMEDHGPGSRSL